MRAKRTRPTGLIVPLLALLVSLASGAIACEATPMDMWITKDPEAGANFDAPVREVRGRDAGDDADGDVGTGTGGTSGAVGDTGSGSAGTTGSGGGGAGGDAGSGGGAGTGGAASNN